MPVRVAPTWQASVGKHMPSKKGVKTTGSHSLNHCNEHQATAVTTDLGPAPCGQVTKTAPARQTSANLIKNGAEKGGAHQAHHRPGIGLYPTSIRSQPIRTVPAQQPLAAQIKDGASLDVPSRMENTKALQSLAPPPTARSPSHCHCGKTSPTPKSGRNAWCPKDQGPCGIGVVLCNPPNSAD